MATQQQKIPKKVPSVIIDTPNLGGIADSPYQGLANSLASIVGFDLHSLPGVMLVNQKLSLDSSNIITDLVKILPCSNGNIYYFGRNRGQVWVKSGGTYSLLGTVSPTTGSSVILDAIEYNGKIYYFMQNNIGSWDFTQSFSSRNDNFATFTNGNSNYHPALFIPNQQKIYIGDGNLIAQVDLNGIFTPNALTLTKELTVSSFGIQGSSLLIGTVTTNGVSLSFVLLWDTWSVAPAWAYPLHEVGVNAFFPEEDDIVFNGGLNGNLYHIAQGTFNKMKQIPPIFPNTYSPTQQAMVNYPAVANKQGIPLFGVSNGVGNVALQGIYSFGSRNENYPKILTLEFPISTSNFKNVTIWSLAVQGNDLYVSWQDTNNGNNFGVDKLDWNNKYPSAYFESRIVKYSRIFLERYHKFVVNIAQALPANTQVNFFYKINGGAYVPFIWNQDTISDTDRNLIYADRMVDAKTLQFKVQITASGNNAPIIEDAVLLL